MASTLFRELVMNGRHRHVLLVVCVQYCLDLRPEIRSQLDLVFSTRENLTSVRSRLFEHYFGYFKNMKEFETAFDACTDKYGCMVVSNQSSSNLLQNHIFWYAEQRRRVCAEGVDIYACTLRTTQVPGRVPPRAV